MFTGIFLILITLALAVMAPLIILHLQRQNRRMEVFENMLGIAMQPFWRHTLKAVAPILLHPHTEYEEADGLIVKALLEPETMMKPEEKERLKELMGERELDNGPNMRPGEQDAAGIFKRALNMAELENASPIAFTKPTVVGTQEVENQGKDSNPATEAASK